jgi:uncharacterized protein YjeT (DUF2065 family)
MGFFISALGLMMIFEGIPYFCFPSKLKAFARQISEIDDGTLRTAGFFLMLFGLFVAYLGRAYS